MIGNTNDFSAYDLVVAPVLYMVSSQLKQKLSDYIANGGNLMTTYLSGLVDQNDNVYLGGYPGALRELTGIWVEENDVVVPKQTIWVDYQGQKYPTELLCDLVHPQETEVLATYASEFYAGMAATTKNNFGKGKVWYFTSQFADEMLVKLVTTISDELALPRMTQSKTKLEIIQRVKAEIKLTFILNPTANRQVVPAEFIGRTDLLSQQPVLGSLESWQAVII